MSIQSDLQEASKLWRNASWYLRLAIIVSTFFTISSIASLSNTIVAWRGFFREGLLFYRDWITGPALKLLAGLRLDGITQQELDLAVLIATPLIAWLRMEAREDIPLPKWYPYILVLWFWGAAFGSNEPNLLDYINPIMYIFIIFGMALMTYKINVKDFIRGFGPLFVAIITIGIAVAISAGFQEAQV